MNEPQPAPDVSVILPTYNRAGLIGAAIGSLLAQTWPSWEAIIVDDGSTDATGQVVASFDDPRLRYVYQENAGVSAARNCGIQLARGRYIAFLDADDLFMPDKLAVQAAALDDEPVAGMVVSGYLFADAQGQPLLEMRPWQTHLRLDAPTLLMGCPIIVNSVLVRRTWLLAVSGFDVHLRRWEDCDLWLRLAHAGCRIEWTPAVLCVYRMHQAQTVRDDQGQDEPALRVLDKFFAQPNLTPALHALRNQSYATAYLSSAFRRYAAGQTGPAAHNLGQALALEPGLLAGPHPLVADALISWAANPTVGDPLCFLDHVLAHLPAAADRLHTLRRRLYGATALSVALNLELVGDAARARDCLAQAAAREPGLLTDTTAFTALLVDAIAKLPEADQVRGLQCFFANLPDACAVWRGQRARVYGQWWAGQGFRAHQAGDWAAAQRALLRAVAYDPRWLRNRGVWSIIWRARSH